MNTPNKLFLATATSWNAQCTTIPFQWFATKIDTQTSVDNQEGPALEAYKNEKEKNIAFVRKLLKMADINIVDVDVEIEEMSDNQSPISGLNFGGLLINNQIIKPKNNRIEVRTGHIVTDETGIQKRYELSLLEESLGTIQLFLFAPFLRKALETGKVLFIDEIDRSLHPFLIRLLVNLFRDNRINANGAQLIFNTHETALLSLGTFRRDQIYFTEKNTENGVTDLYSLDDLSVRKDENIEKGYLLGRYGAIPYLQTEDIVGVIRTHGKIATVFPDTDQSSVLKGRKK
jgi:AAA15 family ATPase/GTPase